MSFVSVLTKGSEVLTVKLHDEIGQFDTELLEKELEIEKATTIGWIVPKLHILEVENKADVKKDGIVSILFLNNDPVEIYVNDRQAVLNRLDETTVDCGEYRKYSVNHFCLNALGEWRNI